ncbi:MAG: DUF3159 domain-containing protein [Pseudonocardia sp.]|nr:DUF3159 domain-containing protein [Pseudonocardia sp.]
MAREPDGPAPSLTDVLGGRTGALDAGVPAVAFVTAWAVAGSTGQEDAVLWGAGAAFVVGIAVAGVRLARGRRPAAVALGLLGVVVASLVVLRTGRAADFFLLQIASNVASALAWITSIAVRWPLLGVIVGLALGQRTRWRADPALLRGYSRASWVWVAQYLVRLAVFIPLYRADQVIALGIARALTWVPVVICVALSWPVIRTALPDGHPGIRYPRARSGGNTHDE